MALARKRLTSWVRFAPNYVALPNYCNPSWNLTEVGLVNNAAAGGGGPAMEATTEILERIFRVNVFGSLYMIQAIAPLMPRGGRIINIGSIASKLGIPFIPIYVAAKSAQDQLAYAAAMEV